MLRFFVQMFVVCSLLGTALTGCTMDVDGRVEKLRIQSEENLKKGRAFLAENAKQQGVITTPSGLQYKVIRSGEGETPALEDKVKAHYRGTLIDGTQFDSSYDRGEPSVFPVNRLIPGWTEALQLMKEGDHWQLFVSSQLAYGKKSPSRKIPPSSTLVFELELISIER